MTKGWKKYSLGELISIKHGYSFKGEYFSPKGKYIILTPGNFHAHGGFRFTPGKEKYFLGRFPEEYICSKDDLIIVMTEQAEGLLGSTALVPLDDTFLHNQRIGLIFLNSKAIDRDFMNYLFRTKNIRSQIRDSASGSKVKHTSPSRICSVQVEIPPIANQRGIGKLLSALDAKIELNHKICAELESLAHDLYHFWFTQFDFPDERGKPYHSSGGKRVWNKELGREIPKGWSIGKLKDIARITMGQSPSGDSFSEEGNGCIFFQGGTDFTFRYPTIRLYTTKPSRIADSGDILFSVRAPVGMINKASEKCCIGRGLSALRSNSGNDSYLLYLMKSKKKQFDVYNRNGTTFGSIDKDSLHGVLIEKAPDDIIRNFNKLTKPVDDQIGNISRESLELTRIRDFLLPLLMNGQVKVSE